MKPSALPISNYIYKILLAAIALLISIPTKAQWVALPVLDDWGEPTGRWGAHSEWTASVNGKGQRIRLLSHPQHEHPGIERHWLTRRRLPPQLRCAAGVRAENGNLGLATNTLSYAPQVMIDGRKDQWDGWYGWSEGMMGLAVYEPRHRKQETKMLTPKQSVTAEKRVVRAWSTASTFKLMLPTRSGNLIYEFNMTGVKEAISKSCPSLNSVSAK